MKQFYTTFLMLLVLTASFAGPVSKDEAKKYAEAFYAANSLIKAGTFETSEVYTATYEDEATFYIYSFSTGGFVIISADDNAKPILGYSLNSPVSKEITHPAILGQFEWYSKQIYHARKEKNRSEEIEKEWNELKQGTVKKSTTSVAPLLTTTWDQGSPYNLQCPENTPTGCVATAMAQIMKYHSWPTTGNGSYQYTHKTYGLQQANFASTSYDWANMPNKLGASSPAAQKDAVATLMHHAGVAVNMNYGPSGSGASSTDVLYALTSYFKYSPENIQYHVFNVANETEWLNTIKGELDQGRPVYYAGSNDTEGHAWVCDGYNDDNKLHINWGWGSAFDGYFLAAAMKPGTYDFSKYNYMITGIMPGNTYQKMLWVKQNSAFVAPSRGITYISAPSNNVVWALGYDGSSARKPIIEYTKTGDGGVTWTSSPVNTNDTVGCKVSQLVAATADKAWIAMYQVTGGGKILHTSDGGSSWTHQTTAAFEAPDGFPNVIHFWDENNGFCQGDPNGGYFEIYNTTDGGTTWTRLPQANIPAKLSGEYGTVEHYEVYNDIVWFATNKGRIFKSTDRGYHWTVTQTPMTNTFRITFRDADHGIIYTVSNTGVYTMYRTSDGGQNWQPVTPTGKIHKNGIEYIPNTNILISAGAASSDYGVSYSADDGSSFNDYADFYKNYQFLAIGTSPEGNAWVGGFNDDHYTDGMWFLRNDAIFANFTVNKTTGNKNDSTVVFTDKSYGDPEGWNWNFGENASPQTLTGKGPHTVKYTDVGYKDVTLTINVGQEEYICVKKNALYVTWPAGINTPNDSKQYTLFPNPASTWVKLSGFERGIIKVYNSSGVMVWESKGTTANNSIDVSGLAPGMYIIRILDTNGKMISKKLTIAK